MRCAIRLVPAVVAAWALASQGARGDTGFGIATPELIRSLLPSVVNIVARTEPPETAVTASSSSDPAAPVERTIVQNGSGFIIDASGTIATNYHVVAGAHDLVVTFSDGSHAEAGLASASRVADIALLKVKTTTKLRAVEWADSDTVQVGDPVIAIGNPLGIGESVSSGIVSGLNRDIRLTPFDDFIQTDAAINHGNSGGPLFDRTGKVIGIDSAIISPTAGSVGLGFAIPSNGAQFVIRRLEKYGKVEPGWLGMTVQPFTEHMALALATASTERSIVADVEKNGPAARAGLQVGDLIQRFGDFVPSDDRALLRAIAETPAGTAVPVALLRGGKTLVVTPTVQIWPNSSADAVVPPHDVGEPRHPDRPDLGLSLAELTAADRAREGLDPAQPGVLVTAVAPRLAAAEARIEPGDVILRVQTAPVATPVDVLQSFARTRAEQRPFVLALVLAKARKKPGARWVVLRLADE